MKRVVVFICAFLMAAVTLPLSSASVAGAQPQPPPWVLGPEVMHSSTCLAGNGRVDTNIVNIRDGAAAYRIEFEGLSARQRQMRSLDWWRQPITGRPDGDHRIVVKRDGVTVSDRIVSVDCDDERPTVTPSEVQVVNSCRNNTGYVLFQFSNPRQTRQGYVIEFEGVPNRSTSAAGHGGAVRAVTGRQAGTYSYLVRDSASSLRFSSGQIVVNCDDPPLLGDVVDEQLPRVVVNDLQLSLVQLQLRPPALTENPEAPIRNDGANGQIIFNQALLKQRANQTIDLPDGEICVRYQIRRGSTTLVPGSIGGFGEYWRQLTCIEAPAVQLLPEVGVQFAGDFAINVDTRINGVGLAPGGYTMYFQPVFYAGGYASGAAGVRMGTVAATTGVEMSMPISVLGPAG